MLIRKVKEGDLGQLIPLLFELGYEISLGDFEVQASIYINSKECELLLAKSEDDEVSGFIAGHLFPLIHQPGNMGRIMAFIVGEKYQSQGVGSSLLESLESWFKENKCSRFEVTSGDHREAAHEFYQSKGYQLDERRFIKKNPS